MTEQHLDEQHARERAELRARHTPLLEQIDADWWNLFARQAVERREHVSYGFRRARGVVRPADGAPPAEDIIRGIRDSYDASEPGIAGVDADEIDALLAAIHDDREPAPTDPTPTPDTADEDLAAFTGWLGIDTEPPLDIPRTRILLRYDPIAGALCNVAAVEIVPGWSTIERRRRGWKVVGTKIYGAPEGDSVLYRQLTPIKLAYGQVLRFPVGDIQLDPSV